VKKLRIADGSIMPTVTTGNTQAPCVIIGERLAEMLNAGVGDFDVRRLSMITTPSAAAV
jgi:choline dehydrogenase-like flavoprotein